ncbi:MAG: hypothetical protein STSR0009_01150 [Methanoregula sp.]
MQRGVFIRMNVLSSRALTQPPVSEKISAQESMSDGANDDPQGNRTNGLPYVPIKTIQNSARWLYRHWRANTPEAARDDAR